MAAPHTDPLTARTDWATGSGRPADFGRALAARLPAIQGRVTANAPLAHMTWLQVGGPAEVLAKPKQPGDLAALLAAVPAEVPVTPIGVASNLLIRDGGIDGLVVRLGRGFATIREEPDSPGLIYAGALALDLNVAKAAAGAGIGGLAFLAGIPGTIGGGVRMNAGAYGREIADVLVAAEVLDRQGRRHVLTPADLGLAYRHSELPRDWIVTGAWLRGEPGQDPAAIQAHIAEIQEQRAATQPIRSQTSGSTFANPPGDRAWRLIAAAGCQGLTRGAAKVSALHANFLLNTGGASAADLEDLGELVRARVAATGGVTLRWEVQRLGVATAPAAGGDGEAA